jgi:hypothetical protein
MAATPFNFEKVRADLFKSISYSLRNPKLTQEDRQELLLQLEEFHRKIEERSEGK